MSTVIDYTRAMGLTAFLIQVSSAVSIGLAYLIHINEIPESRPSSVWKHYWRNTRQDIAVRAVSSMVIIDYSFNIINHLLRS